MSTPIILTPTEQVYMMQEWTNLYLSRKDVRVSGEPLASIDFWLLVKLKRAVREITPRTDKLCWTLKPKFPLPLTDSSPALELQTQLHGGGARKAGWKPETSPDASTLRPKIYASSIAAWKRENSRRSIRRPNVTLKTHSANVGSKFKFFAWRLACSLVKCP